MSAWRSLTSHFSPHVEGSQSANVIAGEVDKQLTNPRGHFCISALAASHARMLQATAKRLASLIAWGVHLAPVVIQLIDLHIDQMVTRHCADIFPDGHFDSSVLMRHKARVRGLWLAGMRLT